MDRIKDDMDEIEAAMDQATKHVKFKLRQRLSWSIVDVVVEQHPNTPDDITARITRARWTMDNPEFVDFRVIHDPDELVAIARLALQAREEMLRLKAANPHPEQQDKQV